MGFVRHFDVVIFTLFMAFNEFCLPNSIPVLLKYHQRSPVFICIVKGPCILNINVN